MGDFTGFTFGGKHSFDNLGILRVSGGDRYEEELFPEVKDITAEVPGVDGEYYFGSNYGPKKIDIEIAFDSLKEEQIREIRRTFGTRQLKELIFDEAPYKKYMAKIESPVELSYVCFDEPKKIIVAKRNGVRRDRENDQDITESVSIIDTVIVPAGTQENPSEVSFTLTHVPNGEVVISSEVEYTYDEETYTYVFSNREEEPIPITLSYSYNEVVGTIPAWEKVTPYKYDDSKTERIYKGEGKISFVCYFPFAKSVFKVIPYSYQHTTDTEIQVDKKYFKLEDHSYVLVDEPNVSEIDVYYERVINKECEEWAISSGIKKIDEYEDIDVYDSGEIKVYNPGDLPVGFRLYIPSSAAEKSNITLTYGTNTLSLEKMTLLDSESGILIDTNNQIIVGADSNKQPTKSLYNRYIKSGSFFKFEPNKEVETLSITGIDAEVTDITIEYDYLYF